MLTESVKEYYSLTKKNEVREAAKKLRRKFLRYKDAEIVYSITWMKCSQFLTNISLFLEIIGYILLILENWRIRISLQR